MNQLYKSNVASTPTVKALNPDNKISGHADDMAKEAKLEKIEALKLYDMGVENMTKQKMGELFSQKDSDPVWLEQEFSKMKNEIAQTMPDERMRVNYMANFDMQKTSYLNKAKTNFKTVELKKKKSSIFDTINNNDQSIGLAFSNVLSGDANPDDFINYKTSLENNRALINTKNDDGTFMFGDSERLAMSKRFNKQIVDSLEATYASLPEHERNRMAERAKNDSIAISDIQGKDGNVYEANIKDYIDAPTYNDIKKKIIELNTKERKQKVAEFNLQRSEAKTSFYQNPTEAGLEELRNLYPEMSEGEEEKYQRALASVNEEAVTSFEGLEEAEAVISELSELPTDNMKEMEAFYNATTDVLDRLKQSNLDNKIDSDDFEVLTKGIVTKMNDQVFRKQIQEMPSVGSFQRLKIAKGAYDAGFSITEATKPLRDKNYDNMIDKIGLETNRKMLSIMAADGIDPKDRKKAVNEVFNQGMEKALRYKYKYLPEMNGELVAGETKLNINGETYIFSGFSNGQVLVKDVD